MSKKYNSKQQKESQSESEIDDGNSSSDEARKLINSESDSESSEEEVEGASPETPADQFSRTVSAPPTPYSHEKLFPLLKIAQQAGRVEFSAKSKSDGRNVSGEVKMRGMEVNKDGNIVNITGKQSGYDENFMTSKKEDWQGLDGEFRLKEDDDATFSKAFEYSRLPTNSYIHFRGEGGVTTGHSGGLIKPLDELSKKKSGKKHWKDIEQKVKDLKPEDSAKKREVSFFAVSALSSTQGEHKVGSLGKESFHAGRDAVIEKVVSEARDGDDILKKASPLKAATEALKFVVNDTVGYSDNNENGDKFRGITTTGLNLEDPVQREYALKHYQASRDKYKLAVLKYEDRLNSSDSESASDGESDDEISVLNRKLQRTKLEEKYHGEKRGDEEQLSPLRFDSPYSRANVEISIAELKKAQSFEEISIVVATPIPIIKPNEDLILEEEAKRRVLDPKAKRELKFSVVEDISGKPSSKPKPTSAFSSNELSEEKIFGTKGGRTGGK